MCHERTLRFIPIDTNTIEELANREDTSQNSYFSEQAVRITFHARRNITEKEEEEAKAESIPLFPFAKEHFRMILSRRKVKEAIGGAAY